MSGNFSAISPQTFCVCKKKPNHLSNQQFVCPRCPCAHFQSVSAAGCIFFDWTGVMQGAGKAHAAGVHGVILTTTFGCYIFYVRNLAINRLVCQGKVKFLKEPWCLYGLINKG